MSSPHPAPENTTFSGALNPADQAQNPGALDDGEKINKSPRPPPRSKSASLLTQALATNYEADEENITPDQPIQTPDALRDPAKQLSEQFELNPHLPHNISTSLPQKPFEGYQQARRYNGLNTETLGDSAERYMGASHRDSQDNGMSLESTTHQNEDGMAMVSSAADPRAPGYFGSSDIASLSSFYSNPRGRGTSLERTNKEKRVEEPPQGLVSTNLGDTGMSGHLTPQSPVTPDITANPPTDGMRARYRSWRDARPPTAERAWSIGQQGTDDSGQVENSIKEALAGVEPNSRSRKASHSMRFFKEGLPEDKLKKKDSKSRTQSKDGTSRGKDPTTAESSRLKPDQDISKEQTSPGSLPSPVDHQRKPKDAISKPDDDLNGEQAEYFNISSSPQQIAEDRMQNFPAQLLADIRKNHNLTPGAKKGTSFSRSIPVTASEQNLTALCSQEPVKSQDHSDHGDFEDDSEHHHQKTDDDEDSGEEHISSAVFVPHQTSHESETEVDEPDSLPRPALQRPDKLEISNSQQWLEEHEVPSRDLDENYMAKEPRPKPLPSPKALKPPTPRLEKAPYFPEAPRAVDIEKSSVSARTINGDDSSNVDGQESDTTPTGSLKREIRPAPTPKLHDHQAEQHEPLEAIELIPYRHQVGGHTTMWRFSKRAVCKQLNNRENEFYEKVERFHPKLLKFLPRYIGVLNVNFEKQRRKPTKKDGNDESTEAQTNGSKANGDASSEAQNGTNRVVSQSLQSGSVPIPMVTFADNRHIIPKSFLRPGWQAEDHHSRSKSDGEAPTQRSIKQTQLPPRDPTSRPDAPSSLADPTESLKRPTLEDKHSASWGSTIWNQALRNKVFGEAFLSPIPIQHHRKPASQLRSLPNRNITVLRNSNSESSLKAAQQSQDASLAQAPEESMRKRALRTAAEQRKLSSASMTKLEFSKEDRERGSENGDGQSGEDKTGTSAPEHDVKHDGDDPKLKRQRRYSSGGLRRKPTEVQEGRGDLKYYEEADDAGYKGDGEEEVFAMDPEPLTLPHTASRDKCDLSINGVDKPFATSGLPATAQGSMLPAAPLPFDDSLANVDIPRPVNPKEAQTQQGSRVEYFLLLEDLTAGMKKPCIMDLKMGTRQYGVEANEKKQKSQRTKCAATTSKELGVRVCGLQVWDVKTQSYVFQDKYFGRDLKVGQEFQNALQRFLYDGVDYSSVLRHIPTILKKLADLEVLIRTLKGYRFYAASLLLFYDGDTAEEGESDSTATEKDLPLKKKRIDFKIADFANCVVQEEYSTDRPCPPRHPDEPDRGFLRGLRSLKKYFLAIQKDIERREMGYAKEENKDNVVGGSIDGANDYEEDEGNVSY